MKTYIIAFFAGLIPMMVLDVIWLSLTVKNFYAKYIGDLMASSPSIAPALVFYPLYIFGLVVLVVMPAIKGDVSLCRVFLLGGLLGLMAYGAYDLTNQSILKNWSTIVTVVDMAWGALITGTAATIAVYLTKLWS